MSWIFFLFLLGVTVQLIGYSLYYGITPTPTSPKVKKSLLAICPSFKPEIIVELGSGWGTLAFALAKRYPRCRIYAYEISPLPYFFSKLLGKWSGSLNIFFIRQNFFEISLKNADIVFCYLYPEAMQKLKIKFEQELMPETYVLSHTFAIPGWVPIAQTQANDLYKTPIYLYQYLQ